MDSLFTSEFLEKDFISYEKDLFKNRKSQFAPSALLTSVLKKYHRHTYVLALFENKLRYKWTINDSNKFIFLSEIISDLLVNNNLSLLGFYNSSKILTRRFIENFYNHVFYFDHPIEYNLLNSGKNEYTPMLELKQYLLSHPVIDSQARNDSQIKIFNDALFNSYHQLCRHVHTKGIEFMGLATNLSETNPSYDIVKHIENINDCILNVIYLLYKFHIEITFTNVERLIISKCFTKTIKVALFSYPTT